MTIAPQNPFPERSPNSYERKMGANRGGNEGPRRFEEGIASDTDVPSDFQFGSTASLHGAPGAPNHNNPEVVFKHAADTMRERAHLGSASWIEAPSFLQEFSGGASVGDVIEYERVFNPGTRQERQSPTVIND